MGDKRTFKIGQLVEVNLNHAVRSEYEVDGHKRVKRVIDWDKVRHETDDLVLAKITGVKSFQEGRHQAESKGGYGTEYEYEAAYFEFEKTVVVWAVRLGYRNKEKYFFKEDIKAVSTEELILFNQMVCTKASIDIPYLYTGWTDEYRKKISIESKDWPRKNGKWSK